MTNSTAVQGSNKCFNGLAKLTDSNEFSIKQFINCNSNLKKARFINMFEINCNVTKNAESRYCPTFLEIKKRNRIRCLKICWTYPFDYITVCNKKPKSYVLRNCMMILFSLSIVIIGICIGKNWYSIKVGCN